MLEGSLHGVMVNMLDYSLKVNEFKFQSHYDVPFRSNTLEKGVNPFILPTIG